MKSASRRAVLGAAAALAGGSVVNLAALAAIKAAEPDPVFALIARHCALRAEIEATDYGNDWDEEDRRLSADVARLNGITHAILTAPFSTLAGMAAVLRYMNGPAADPDVWVEDDGDAFLDRLADALERMAVAS